MTDIVAVGNKYDDDDDGLIPDQKNGRANWPCWSPMVRNV